MTPDLQARFDTIEAQRAALTRETDTLTPAQFAWTPGGGVWSVGQIIEHLVLSDRSVGLRDTGDKVEALPFRLMPSGVRYALVLRALRRDLVLPLPSPDIAPGGETDWPTLRAQWASVRTAMRDELNLADSAEGKYWHAVLGYLAPAQMLELGAVHNDYHTRQIVRLRARKQFPASNPQS